METDPSPQRIFEQGHIAEEIDFCDPLALFAPLAHEPFALFLDSSAPTGDGRWSFIATDPFATLRVQDGKAFLEGHAQSGTGFDCLRKLTEEHALNSDWLTGENAAPFAGGFAGIIGYDMAHALEVLPKRKTRKSENPDMAIGAYDCVLAFDHWQRRAFIISTGLPEKSAATRAARAEARAAKWRTRVKLRPALPQLHWPERPAPDSIIKAPLSRATYEERIQKVIDYIFAGDIFQANLSQRFEGDLQHGDSALTLYRRLRALSPAPFAGFFNFGDGQVLSSSPERFVRMTNRNVEAKPVKGTRPRSTLAAEDRSLARELQESEKDRAENVMIVDLLRNDLSRVAKPGSLRVPSLCKLESFANVHHLVSTVTATLDDKKNAVDLLQACFPGGSITGAPKIRAMEIIHELEDEDRGPYCGSLGYLSFDGQLDMNISIRTICVEGEKFSFRAGGGIVADSDPIAEYDETITKARAMADAVRGKHPAPGTRAANDAAEDCA
ncbi:MAG: aminodeoxychorismate synthase component I [Parvibaculum sp.]